MDTIFVIVLIFCLILPLYKLYEPRIDVVVLFKHYQVYLWYNKYEEGVYTGRTYKYLFEI